MKVFVRILLILVILLLVAEIGFVGYGIYKKATLRIQNPIATMEVEGYGTIKMELYPDMAPNTVANFIKLANNGYYNGLNFHRTIPDFMIQGGSKNGDGTGSPKLSDLKEVKEEEDKEYCIPGEFIANGYNDNILKHETGVVSMARASYGNQSTEILKKGYNSAGSQFFIMTANNTSLDGTYAAFGKVIEGMDVVEKIANVKVVYRDSELEENAEAPKDSEGNTIASDKPIEPPIIKSITVETFGIDYGMPTTLDVFDYYSYIMQQYYGYSF